MKKFIIVSLIIATSAASFAQNADTNRVYMVRVKKPVRATIAEKIVQTGAFEAPEAVVILPKISGRLARTELEDGTKVDVGTKVTKGETIAAIESDDYAARATAAEAALENAQASFDDATRDFDRTAALLRDDTATQQDADKAETALARAKAAVKAAEADLTLARINLSETKLRAPFDGVIAAKSAHAGAMLSPSTPVFTIVATDYLKLFFDLPTTAFPKIKPDVTDVLIAVDAYPADRFEQKIYGVYPIANNVTRTVRIELRVDNADGKFLPGMYARGNIELNKRVNVLAVDWESVVKTLDKTIVYVIEEDRAAAREVKLGTRQDDIIEILEGISDDDDIVFVGQNRLTDGVKVKID